VQLFLQAYSTFYTTEDTRNVQNLSASYEYSLDSKTKSELQLLSENDDLRVEIANYLATISKNEREINKLEGKVDDLDTIVKTDPELLAKYSKVFFLNENYTPASIKELDTEFVYPPGKKITFHGKLIGELEDMLEDAKEDDITLLITSGFRSFDEQRAVKTGYSVTYGAGANAFSADQGYSEHQLGTTVDIVTPNHTWLTAAFDQTEAFAWLTDNAHRYGFVLSYPKGNAFYSYEPWHWRYVGQRLATKLHRDGINFYDMDQRDIDKYVLYFFD
jgi:LAS superfamily LD-carboxypeptidase LdcB